MFSSAREHFSARKCFSIACQNCFVGKVTPKNLGFFYKMSAIQTSSQLKIENIK